MRGFRKRHPELTIKNAPPRTRERVAAAYENIIRKFIFEVVEKTITENKLTPKQIHIKSSRY